MEFFALLGRLLAGPNEKFTVSSTYQRRCVAIEVHPTSMEDGSPVTLSIRDLGPRPEWEAEQAEERARRWPPLTDPLLIQVIAERRAAGLYS